MPRHRGVIGDELERGGLPGGVRRAGAQRDAPGLPEDPAILQLLEEPLGVDPGLDQPLLQGLLLDVDPALQQFMPYQELPTRLQQDVCCLVRAWLERLRYNKGIQQVLI